MISFKFCWCNSYCFHFTFDLALPIVLPTMTMMTKISIPRNWDLIMILALFIDGYPAKIVIVTVIVIIILLIKPLPSVLLCLAPR